MRFIDLKKQYELIADDVNQAIQKVLEHGQYIMGPEIKTMEEQLAAYVGVKHGLGVASGTDALLLALLALDVKAGDEVITTPFSFIATVETICLIGAKPVFVDIDPQTYCLNPELIEDAITDKTKAIMPVGLYGQCADYQAINAIANQHEIAVIEDAAQSFGAMHHGKRSCGLTTIGCTSFFPSKPLGCYGDGGACFTNDDDLALKMQQLRVHGQEKRYYHTQIGVNARMDTLQAAVIVEKFKLFEQEIKLREEVVARYRDLLADHITVPFIPEGNTSVYAQYTVQVNERDKVRAALQAQDIPTAVHYPVPLYRQPCLTELAHYADHCPVTEEISATVMSLPMHPYLTAEEQQQVAAVLLAAL